MLAPIVYCDLVDLGIDEARDRLLAALLPSGKPTAPPPFPGGAATVATFPGPIASVQPPADVVRAAGENLKSLFATSRTTFRAQARLRDDLAGRIIARLGVTEHLQYEELFDSYFDRLQADELRLHRTIRVYTESILHEYNARTLAAVDAEPRLAGFLPSLEALRQHLILWLTKFEHVFRRTPSMCLLYVGVEEGVGFPRQIETELDEYLSTAKPA
jgi:hypothetical protein